MVQEPERRITARHVAAELGVSVKTVGNAFGRPDQLSPALRERILAAAGRLGYAGPDPVAAGLRGRRVGAIGIVYANGLSYAFDDPSARDVLAGAAGVAGPAGAGLLLLPGSADAARRAAAVSRAVIDGLVAYSLADDDPLLARAAARRLPVAVIDQPRPPVLASIGLRASWTGTDDRGGARALADHLLGLGHRRLAVVTFGITRNPARGFASIGQQDGMYAVTRDRLAGFRDAAVRSGLDWATVPVWQGTDSTPEEGAMGAEAILRSAPDSTALLCLSDRLAEGALSACRAAGLRVPEDVSVTGYDDAPTAAGLALTTVRQPHRTKGERAARLLLATLDGEDPRADPPLTTELVLRKSSRPPA